VIEPFTRSSVTKTKSPVSVRALLLAGAYCPALAGRLYTKILNLLSILTDQLNLSIKNGAVLVLADFAQGQARKSTDDNIFAQLGVGFFDNITHRFGRLFYKLLL
jgi:hypothetical protein